jgi:hypothetical protein
MELIVLAQGFDGRRLNRRAMTDLPTLAATLLGHSVTIRIPRCERLWSWPDLDPSLRRHIKSLSIALAGERLIADCHLHFLRQRLLDAGHRAFFDRIEGGGPDGWRLHFFCLDPSAVTLLCAAGVGQCGSGDPASFDAKEFVMRRLRQLERSGCLDRPHDWWWFFDWFVCRNKDW